MRIISPLGVLFTVVAALGFAASPAFAGGGGHGGAVCHVTSDGAELTMLDNCFEGIVHSAEEDATLTVRNDGEIPHTITAVDGSFDSGRVPSGGGTFQIALDEAGEIPIYCTVHGTQEGQGMAGLLRVGGPASGDLASATATSGGGLPASAVVAGAAGLAVGALFERRRTVRSRDQASDVLAGG